MTESLTPDGPPHEGYTPKVGDPGFAPGQAPPLWYDGVGFPDANGNPAPPPPAGSAPPANGGEGPPVEVTTPAE